LNAGGAIALKGLGVAAATPSFAFGSFNGLTFAFFCNSVLMFDRAKDRGHPLFELSKGHLDRWPSAGTETGHQGAGNHPPGAPQRVDFIYNLAGERAKITRSADLAGTQVVATMTAQYDAAGRLTEWQQVRTSAKHKATFCLSSRSADSVVWQQQRATRFGESTDSMKEGGPPGYRQSTAYPRGIAQVSLFQ
jgi:hypothetical protein